MFMGMKQFPRGIKMNIRTGEGGGAEIWIRRLQLQGHRDSPTGLQSDVSRLDGKVKTHTKV